MQQAEEQFNDCCSLSRKQRLYGWLFCMLLGGFLEFLSTVFFWGKQHIAEFAIAYSLQSVLNWQLVLLRWARSAVQGHVQRREAHGSDYLRFVSLRVHWHRRRVPNVDVAAYHRHCGAILRISLVRLELRAVWSVAFRKCFRKVTDQRIQITEQVMPRFIWPD